MGSQDRDWYWEHRAEVEAREKQAARGPFKKPVQSVLERVNPYYVKPSRPWHPVFQILLFVVICFGTFLILRFFKR